MKKTIRILSTLLVFIILSTFCVSADILSDFCWEDFGEYGDEILTYEGWAYVKNTEYVRIVAYKGDEVNLVIPEEIDGLPVKELILFDRDYINKSGAFPHFENKIETLTIPKTLNQITYDWRTGIPDHDLYDPDASKSGTRFSGLFHKDGTEYLNDYFLSGMHYLKGIIVDEENEYFSSQDGVLFNKDKTVLIAYPQMKIVDEYVVPETVEKIYDYAFSPGYYSKETRKQIDQGNFSMIDKLVITKNVKKIGNFVGGYCNTVVIDNVILDEKSINFYNADEVIVYKDSLPHKYYKKAIAETKLKKPKLTVVANPYAKEEPEKEKTSSKDTPSKKPTSSSRSSKNQDVSSEPNTSIASDTTESVVSEPEKTEETTESEVLTIGATESEATENKNETKPQKSSKVWIMVVIAAAVVLAGGGTAYWFIRKKKKA